MARTGQSEHDIRFGQDSQEIEKIIGQGIRTGAQGIGLVRYGPTWNQKLAGLKQVRF